MQQFPTAGLRGPEPCGFAFQPFQFAERKCATGRVAGHVLEHAEDHLLRAVFRKISAECGGTRDFVTVGKCRAGIDRVAAKTSAGIELFQRQTPRIDARMTARTSWLVAVAFQLFTQRQAGVVFPDLRHIRRRVLWWFSDDASRQPCATTNRTGLATVGKPGKDGGLREHSAGISTGHGNTAEFKAGLQLLCQPVIGGGGVVEHTKIGVDECGGRQVVANEFLQILHGFFAELPPGIASQSRKAAGVDIEHIKAVEAEPFGRQRGDSTNKPRIRNQPLRLFTQLFAESPGGGELQQGLVGGRIPQEVSQF